MYTIGFDVGTSYIKASLMNVAGNCIGTVSVPEKEMAIIVPRERWAEQNPDSWWENVILATQKLKSETRFASNQIKAIGISYQMHGLVLVDKKGIILRPSIIWCDSRAVETGELAFQKVGIEKCLNQYLNSPGNFTASKLKWVMENEPEIAEKIYKAMLPGDFIAMKMTGEITTTVPGLSEGVFWDFKNNSLADDLLLSLGIEKSVIPDVVSTFGEQAYLSSKAAGKLGLCEGTPITYRAGDQPNNAFSLNVLNPGEVAATAGTSAVIYGVGDKAIFDQDSRVNTFAHVNHREDMPRLGTLLCVNGAGIMNSWLRNTVSPGKDKSYEYMNEKAAQVKPGSNGLKIFPFGNGAERLLKNQSPSAWIEGLNFNSHTEADLFRATQEGIANTLNYGIQIIREMNINASVVRAGQANMFLSPVFREAFVNTTGCVLELYHTDGSLGAARAAAMGLGIYDDFEDCFKNLKSASRFEPDNQLEREYNELYNSWLESLNKKII